MKRNLKRTLAIFLSFTVLLSTVLIGGIFSVASTAGAYKGTLLDLYSAGSTNSAFGVSAERYDNTLSGIKGVTVNYGWSAANLPSNTAYEVNTMYPTDIDVDREDTVVNGTTVSYKKFTDKDGNIIGTVQNGKLISYTDGEIGNIHANAKVEVDTKQYATSPVFYEFGEGDAVMFYVKMPASAPSTEWLFQMVAASMAKASDGVVYPAVGTNQNFQLANNGKFSYLAKGTEKWVEKSLNRSHIDGRLGHIVFPEGFEGWIKIPYSSFFDEGTVSNFVFRINIRPKSVGGDYTEDGVSFGSFMFLENGSEEKYKVRVTEEGEAERTADLIREREHNLVAIPELKGVTGAVKVENETAIPSGYSYRIDNGAASFSFNGTGAAVLKQDAALLLYAKVPLGEDGGIRLTANKTFVAESGSVYATLNRGERSFTEGVIDGNSYINLKAGFEGYILVSAAAFGGRISLTDLKIEAATAPVAVGTVALTQSEAKNTADIKIVGSDDYINLYKKAYYNATALDTEDTVENPYADKNYLSISGKTPDPTFTVGIENGYYYEYGAGSAERGEYEEALDLEVPPYNATLITKAENVYTRPSGQSPFNIVGNYTVPTPIGDTVGVKVTVNTSVVPSGEHYNPSPTVSGTPAPQYAGFYTSDNRVMKVGGAFMFYVDHSDSEKAVNMALGIGQSWYMTQSDRAYFRFDITKGKWENFSTKAINGFGFMEIPAGFKGWIRVPLASIKYGSSELSASGIDLTQKQINLFPDAMGGDYGELLVGGMMLLDEADNRYDLLGVKYKSQAINEEVRPSYHASYITAVNNAYTYPNNNSPYSISNLTSVETPIGNTVGVKITVNTQKVPSGEHYNASPKVSGGEYGNIRTNTVVMKKDGSVMFWLEHTGATKSIKVSVGCHGGWAMLTGGRAYYLYDSVKEKWEVYASESIEGFGFMEIPAGFKGWVRVPSSSLTQGGRDITADTDHKELNLFINALGGAYGELLVGGMMTVDEADNREYIVKADNKVGTVGTTADPKIQSELYTHTVAPYAKNASATRLNVSIASAQTVTTPIGNMQGVRVSASEEIYIESPTVGDGNTRRFFGFVTGDSAASVNFSKSGSVMLWLDRSDSTKAMKAAFGFHAGWAMTQGDRAYYLFDSEKGDWQTFKAETINGFGFLTIPAGFKGWLRVPASSLKQGSAEITADVAQNTVHVFPNGIGGAYGSLTIGGVMLLSETDNRYFIKSGESEAVAINDIVKKGVFAVKMDEFLGEKYFETEAPREAKVTEIKLKTQATLTIEDALMFYVTKSGTSATSIRITLGASCGMMLQSGAEYSVYDSSTGSWTPQTAGDYGKISIDAGFEGWVRIPYRAFADTDGNSASQDIVFDGIGLLPDAVGGAYGELRAGNFTVTDNGEADLTTIRVNAGVERPLSTAKYYEGNELEVAETFTSGNAIGIAEIANIRRNVFKAPYLNYVITATDNLTMDSENAFEMSLSKAVKLDGDNAILFYIDLADNPTNKLILGGDMKLKANGEYYLLGRANDAAWKRYTAADGSKLSLPTGFEGFIRIPAASFAKTEITDFVFGFEKLKKDSAVQFGNLILINNGSANYTDLKLNGAASFETLLLSSYNEGYVLQGAYGTLDDAAGALKTEALGNSLTPAVSDGYAYKTGVTGDPVKLADGAYAPRTVFVVDALYRTALSPEGGVMFYVELPAGGQNGIFLQARAEDYGRLSEGAAYYLLGEGDNYWTTRAANTRNELLLPEGFKGWVRIPTASFTTSTGVAIEKAVTQFNLSWRFVGGAHGEPKIGTFINLTDSADSGKLLLSGLGELNLYGQNGKKEYDRDDVAVWESVNDPFEAYEIGDNIALSPSLSVDHENEHNSVFTGTVIDKIPEHNDSLSQKLDINEEPTGEVYGHYKAPFGTKGVEITSSEHVWIHGDHYPRFSLSYPFSLEGAKGIVLYLNVPEVKGEESGDTTSNLFLQLRTARNEYFSVKYTNLVMTLPDGTEHWRNVVVSNQRICLPSGFEGYIYVPLEALETYKRNSDGWNEQLSEYDVINRLVLGIGEHGGSDENGKLLEDRKVYLGGVWLSKNGVLSHNGAYVDGSDKVKDVFTGETLSADKIAYDKYEAPGEAGFIYDALPEATVDEFYVMDEYVSGHEFGIAWDAYPGADGYRIDIYKSEASLLVMDLTFYNYQKSVTVGKDTQSYMITGVDANSFYTVVVVPLKNGKGIGVYPAASIYTEVQVVGNMLYDGSDSYKHPWFEDDEEPDGSENDTQKKKIIKRRRMVGPEPWLIIVIAAAAVLVAGGTVLLIIILKKRKKKNGTAPNVNAAGEEEQTQ